MSYPERFVLLVIPALWGMLATCPVGAIYLPLAEAVSTDDSENAWPSLPLPKRDLVDFALLDDLPAAESPGELPSYDDVMPDYPAPTRQKRFFSILSPKERLRALYFRTKPRPNSERQREVSRALALVPHLSPRLPSGLSRQLLPAALTVPGGSSTPSGGLKGSISKLLQIQAAAARKGQFKTIKTKTLLPDPDQTESP